MYDVVIVGGGPAGLSAALMLGRCRRRVIVVDAGQPRNQVAHEFHGFIGRDGSDPKQLLADARREVQNYGVEIRQDTVTHAEPVTNHDPSPLKTSFRLQTLSGLALQCRKLLFATGLCDELPGFAGLAECYGISVHHCPYCDAWEHRGQAIAAYGHSVSAGVGLARLLRTWSDQVTVVTNGEPAPDKEQEKASLYGISLREEPVARLVHEEGRLIAIQFRRGEPLPAQALFFNTSQRAHSQLPRTLGCEFKEEAFARSGRKQTTNVPGLFVAGDADGDVQFVVVAAAEGASAAVAIHTELLKEDFPVVDRLSV